MKQTEDVARYELYSSSVTPVDVATLVSQNPDVWLRGCAGVELNDEEWLSFIFIADLVTISINSAWEKSRLFTSPQSQEKVIYRMAPDLHINPGLRKAWEARRGHAHQRNEFVNVADTGFSRAVESMLEEVEKHPPEVLTHGPLCGSR